MDSAGNVFVNDSSNRRIRRIDGSGGEIATILDAEGSLPLYIAVDSAGNAYIAYARRIQRIAGEGLVSVIGGTAELGFSGDGARLAEPRFPFRGSR